MIRWTSLLAALVLLLTAGVALRPSSAAAKDNPTPVATSTTISNSVSSLAVVQICSGGRVNATFQWQGNDPYAYQVWLDLSITDTYFGPGTFVGAGPLPGFATSYTWNGLIGGTTHYVRINQQLSNGAWDPGVFTFSTNFCGGGSSLPPAPGPGPFAGAPASILSLNCTSSLATASLNNVAPASTQTAGLNAWANDRINCTASVSGPGQLTWRGPNNDVGYGGQFSTTVGSPRPGGAPYDISLQLDWGGNPAIAHISVTPVIQNTPLYSPYNPYQPYQPYNPYQPMNPYGMPYCQPGYAYC